MKMLLAIPLLLMTSGLALAQSAPERTVDPTFLYRSVPDVAEASVGISSATAHYQPLFGEGDPNSKILKSVSRFGELTVDAGGRSNTVSYDRQEGIFYILDGAGSVSYAGKDYPVRKDDFLYLPPGVKFGLNGGEGPVKAALMGFNIPDDMPLTIPDKLEIANSNDVPLQNVGGHPKSALYRLLMGGTDSTRDRISTGHVMMSLFIMEFEPGGTNFPHHHETQEEIYLLLNGKGEMVAGGGMDGIEARFPAKPGDAYFYRANTTVGFYNDPTVPGRPADTNPSGKIKSDDATLRLY